LLLKRSRKNPLNSGTGAVAIADMRTRLYIEEPNEGIWEGHAACRGRIKAPDYAVKTT
jgi:hypothetical protein